MAGVGGRSVSSAKVQNCFGPWTIFRYEQKGAARTRLEDLHGQAVGLKLWLYVLYVRTYESENTEYTDHDYTEYANAFYDSLSMQTRFTIH